MADEFVHEGEIVHAKPLARSAVRDARLSWGARGLFLFLWDLPGNWRPCVDHLAKMGPDGERAVRSRLAELEQVGAVRFEPIRDQKTGQLRGKRWVVVSAHLWAVEAPLKKSHTENDVLPTSAEAPSSAKKPPKVHLERKGSPKTEEEQPTFPHVDKLPAWLAGFGLIVQNEEDLCTCQKLLPYAESRPELLREAVALGPVHSNEFVFTSWNLDVAHGSANVD